LSTHQALAAAHIAPPMTSLPMDGGTGPLVGNGTEPFEVLAAGGVLAVAGDTGLVATVDPLALQPVKALRPARMRPQLTCERLVARIERGVMDPRHHLALTHHPSYLVGQARASTK